MMTPPELELTPDGLLLPVQAQPRARKNSLSGWHADRLKVCVTQAPEKGKANQALLKLLAKSLGLKRSQIQLVSGETSTQKMFCIQDITAEELLSRIDTVLTDS
ncbi:MAG: DUF167 domain-containing protein [Planctomycetaceae bacterium]|nr:DUF167 domain-containing protein [Planctomycetaceae bacterium]